MTTSTILDTKICSKCHQEFPRTNEFFHRRSGSKDGLNHYCKSCHREASKQRNAKKRLIFESTIKTEADHIRHLSQFPATKTCPKCNQELLRTTEYFDKNFNHKDGLQPRCKQCERDRSKQYHTDRRQNDPEYREVYNEASSQWAKDNRDKANAKNMARKAHVLEANPAYSGKPQSQGWLLLEKSKIEAIYSQANQSGQVVDHIIPLQAKKLPYKWAKELYNNRYDYPEFKAQHHKFQVRYGLVCGLHVSSNCRPLDQSDNKSKSNKFQTYREANGKFYILSKDGSSWLPIDSEDLHTYPWIIIANSSYL